MTEVFTKLKHKLLHAKQHWLTIAFLLGFVVDNLTLNRVDQKFDNAILASYVILAMVGMLALYAGIASRFTEKVSGILRDTSPYLIQYAFGGLLSGMLIFYGRSGSIDQSWPFILLILFVIFGNETIKNREQRLVYNLSIFFVGLLSYFVLIIPVILGKMGTLIFLSSGLLALVVMYAFFALLTRVVPNFIELQRRNVIFFIGLIYVIFNFLYFLNIIPPIPLSLKDIGIYHSVVRFETDMYQVAYERPAWWQFYQKSDRVFHYGPGDNAFCFASVFAPTRLETKIYHRWEYFDDGEGEWVEHGRYTYPIQGGRDGGFRGYTQISNSKEGTWRCTVETERGQVLGRTTFKVEDGPRGELVPLIK